MLYFYEQTRIHDVEIIIVDDCSEEPVQKRVNSERFLFHRNDRREGIARSRNIGAALATGDVLLFTDGHVYFSENWFYGIESCCGQFCILGPKTRIIYEMDRFLDRNPADDPAAIYYGWKVREYPEEGVEPIREKSDQIFSVPYVGGGFLAIDRQTFQTLGGFDYGLINGGGFGDCELAMRLVSMGGVCCCNPEITLYHYTAPQPPIDWTRRCPLDHPRYDSQIVNCLRAYSLHFPEREIIQIVEAIQEKYPKSYERAMLHFRQGIDYSAISSRIEAERNLPRRFVFNRVRGR